jgi:hypothetical protein
MLIVFYISLSVSRDEYDSKQANHKDEHHNELPKVDEDKEMEIDDGYELDEEVLMSNIKNIEPNRERTISVITKEKDEIELQKVRDQYINVLVNSISYTKLSRESCKEIERIFDFKGFINRSLQMLASVLSKRSLNQQDKNMLNIVVTGACTIFAFKEEYLPILYNFNDEETNTDLKQLIVKGLTYSTDAAVKKIFGTLIEMTCFKIKHTKEARLPIMVILELMKDHFFESIKESSRYYGYKEYYTTFGQLIKEYFVVQKNRNKKFENIIEPEIFLKQLLVILKNYKTKEKRNTVLEDHCLIGIFEVIQTILSEKPEFIDEFAIEHGLLKALWFDCLFQEQLDAPHIDVSSEFDQNSSKFIYFKYIIADLHTNKCKTKESRAKAFVVLNLICNHSSKARDYIYRDCLYKMVACLERPENFATQSGSESRSFYSYAGLKNQGAT